MSDLPSSKSPATSFLLPTENLHPTVQKHLEGRLDVLVYRQLQGEFAKYYRFLKNYAKVDDLQKFSIKLCLNKEAEDALGPVEKKVDVLTIDTNNNENGPLSQAIINDVFVRHLNEALEEIKEIALRVVLEEIKEVSFDNFENAVKTKKDLEGRSAQVSTAEEEILDLFTNPSPNS
jgi:SpoVK/Ycf46/Vps4 family AAA+-type ATPase